MALKSRNKVSPNFNMSSMTDIVFLLLIFFMLTSTLVSPNALKLLLPNSKSKTLEKQTISVSINKDLDFYINENQVIESNLENELKDTEINEFKPILSRVKPLNIQDFYEKEEKMNEEDNNIIQIDDFMKVDLRVAKVEEASHVEGADKLLAIKLDLGDLGTKNVFAGIKSAYEPSQLEGKLVVMVYNLAPRKMKFGLSEGMILAASDSDGGIFVLSPDLGAKPGQKIK